MLVLIFRKYQRLCCLEYESGTLINTSTAKYPPSPPYTPLTQEEDGRCPDQQPPRQAFGSVGVSTGNAASTLKAIPTAELFPPRPLSFHEAKWYQ